MNSIKCPGCGLVNFATASECKRCQMSFESPQDASDGLYPNPEYQGYWPQKPEYDQKQKLFSGGVVFLTGILVVGMVFLVLQQAFHPLDPSSAKGIGGVVGLVGILLMFVTHIWLLIRIFEQSVGWGVASLFLPLVGLIAVAQFWEKTKRSFIGQMVCVGILFVGIGIGL